MRAVLERVLPGALGIVVGLVLVGCVDEDVVYRDRPLFEDPPQAAAGFLGFNDQEAKRTVCGSCHVATQSHWNLTAHADAWKSLQESGHAEASCNGCHTVSELGNKATGNVAFSATGDTRYYDVQCESCHGPGLEHVLSPDGNPTKPLASMVADPTAKNGCGECHQGTHHPFVEEWQSSAHGAVHNQGHTGDNASCNMCHTGENALKSWGIDRVFAEQTEVAQTGKHLAITCAVCHDPHSAANPAQLRFSVTSTDEEKNLCMKCHHKRGAPDTTTWRGAHSPEGPLLVGTAGWWPANMASQKGQIVGTHGSQSNPKLCVGCHMATYAVSSTQNTTGHLFNAIPCKDSKGVPTNGDCEPSQRTFKSCTASGCHGSEAAARSALLVAEARVEELAATLDATLKKVTPSWKTCRTNNSCGVGSPFSTIEKKYTTAEGAGFNYDLAVHSGSVVHNPFLVEALLLGSIKQVRTDYGVTAPPGVNLEPELGSN